MLEAGYIFKCVRLSPVALLPAILLVANVKMAEAKDTHESCKRTYLACDAKCQAEDPKHGFTYAKCSASCVASKASCDGGIMYDAGANWTKKQYDTAKPWVQKKTKQAEDLAEDAAKNSKPEYSEGNATGN